MSAKVVAIAGATGHVGTAFTNALLDLEAFELRILARVSSVRRSAEMLRGFRARGATLCLVSYEEEASLVSALHGVHVLISAVAGEALISAQLALIKAAKTAGVSVFFPSEFGGRIEHSDNPSPLVQNKRRVAQAARDAGLPIAALSTGACPEYCLIPPLGYAFTDRKVTIWGDGSTKITFTTIRSVSQWIAHVLKDVPVTQLQNKLLRIQGDLAQLEVNYRPLREVEERIKADANDFFAVLLLEWYSGRTELKPLDNSLYPEWKPEPVESTL